MSSWRTSEWAQELRQLWNNYDPIGVYHFEGDGFDGPSDEYDSYHGLVLKLLKERSSDDAFLKELKQLTTGHIGLTWSDGLEKLTKVFIKELRSWYAIKSLEVKT